MDWLRREAGVWREAFAEHDILAYASAIAFRTFVALIPLALFALALLHAAGLEDVWDDRVAPAVRGRVFPEVFSGLDFSVHEIFRRGSAGLLVFAGALLLWDVSSAVRACMGGINRIYEVGEERPTGRRFLVSLGLGAFVACAVLGAILLVLAAPRVSGAAHWPLLVLRWTGTIVVLGLAIGLVVRFGPADRRSTSWSSVGTTMVVVFWVAASLVFRYFVSEVASFKSAAGVLAVFLVLTSYLYTSAIVFLVGVQLDELMRKRAAPGERGVIELVARLLPTR